MVDRKLKPWLIEVNSMPSFNVDTPHDKITKKGLIRDTFNILNLT